MAGFGATLTTKRGPLPTWAWAGLGVAILAFVLVQRKKKAAAAAAAAAAASGDGTTGAGTTGGGASGTDLGSNTLSNLVPTAYPMPFQQGDVYVNTPPATATATSGTTTTITPPATPAAPTGQGYYGSVPRPTSYVVQKGDTWDTIGQKLNFAPVLLWEANGAPAGFKMPAPGTKIDTHTLVGDPGTVFANQAKIVASEKALAGGK